MDIIANHTADVIKYRECEADKPCAYRSRADYPYTRKGGVSGPAINPGFLGDGIATPENFARLTDPNWAYTPYFPKGRRRPRFRRGSTTRSITTIAAIRPSRPRIRSSVTSPGSTI